MSNVSLTIGMAVYNDFRGVWFTIQALRLNNDLRDVELVVVDNFPQVDSPDGTTAIQRFLTHNASNGTAGTQYVSMPAPVGTTVPRNHIFKTARGEWVLCLDSHVLLPPGTINNFKNWLKENGETKDLVQGPLILDNHGYIHTVFADVWRSEMWGVWGTVWQCKCGKNGTRFIPLQKNGDDLQYTACAMGNIPLTHCKNCKTEFPKINWAGHESQLAQRAYKALGADSKDEAFEIPGQGLGLFASRKDSWLGFNEKFFAFGGEEMYIHEKYRQHGRKTICVPLLPYNHCFTHSKELPRPPVSLEGKIHNYIVGHNELGLSLDRAKKHFVEETKRCTPEQWQYAVEQGEAFVGWPEKKQEGCGMKPNPYDGKTVEEIYVAVQTIPRDLEKHFPKLRELATGCQRITEFTKRRESTVALAAGLYSVANHTTTTIDPQNPERKTYKFTSYNLESNDSAVGEIGKLSVNVFDFELHSVESPAVAEITETDLLFIDSQHTYERLRDELKKFAPRVSRYIVLHDTALHGFHGEDGGAGLLQALKEFMRDDPKWSIVYHTQDQYGLTVLSCNPIDKPSLPSLTQEAKNFLGALARFVAEPAFVAKEDYEKRLDICALCELRNGSRCSVCGCFLEAKAKPKTESCPLSKW